MKRNGSDLRFGHEVERSDWDEVLRSSWMGDGGRGSESSSFSAISSTNGSEREGGGDREVETEREKERDLRGLRGPRLRVLKAELGRERRRRWCGGRREVEG